MKARTTLPWKTTARAAEGGTAVIHTFGVISFLFIFWPLLLLCQGVLGLYFLCFARPLRCLLASGILMMLVLVILAVSLGWLLSPTYVLDYILGAF